LQHISAIDISNLQGVALNKENKWCLNIPSSIIHGNYFDIVYTVHCYDNKVLYNQLYNFIMVISIKDAIFESRVKIVPEDG
jgi:hypothetical protein